MGAFETQIRPLSKMGGVPFWETVSVIRRIVVLEEEKAKIEKELVMLKDNLAQRVSDGKPEQRGELVAIIHTFESLGINAAFLRGLGETQ